ncbi:hypothetical protein QTH91_15155 [Variovorax dokdonensis]|uniref:Type IV pilus assembly protein PilX n=1 Tax=Variovorax dokdonensis TaxID=344883 RepID=A0ABT7NCZ6_9BURK|nr:PilX N-terminal domain-containing pilus assembly protein [Variovorax dokdonensis]MDM0045824.1 hypothetical protein [Variovorax dokdonensis]
MNRSISASRCNQQGLALMIVMIVLLMATLLVVGAARTTWFTERLIGNDADQERALANAQAMLADAEYDIRAESPDGRPCTGESPPSPRNCRAPGDPQSSVPWIPREGPLDFARLRNVLMTQAVGGGIACAQGVCLAGALPARFWQLPPAELARIENTGARYAQFSGAPDAPADNPLLSSRAWYWIEILPYSGPTGTALAPDADNPFIFRITALASGRRPTTQVVLERLFVWKRVDA